MLLVVTPVAACRWAVSRTPIKPTPRSRIGWKCLDEDASVQLAIGLATSVGLLALLLTKTDVAAISQAVAAADARFIVAAVWHVSRLRCVCAQRSGDG